MGDKNLITQIIINKMEQESISYLSEKKNINILNNNIRNEIKIWAKKMYEDYEKDNEIHEIINNTAMPDWYREYIDYDKLDKLIL
jgi:hypothetical protein